MYAKTLERLLARLIEKSDVTSPHPTDTAKRFDALRGFGCLPRGRENRDRKLTSLEIANCVFGLATAYPAWAGQASIVLAQLRPVGGVAASFRRAETLSEAVALLIDDDDSRTALAWIELSVCESGTNSHGFATITHETPDGLRKAHFVPAEAISLLAPGREVGFDPYRSVQRRGFQLILDGRFFARIAKEVEYSRITGFAPEGDGSEYDAEDAAAARNKALEIAPRSRFLHLGADNQVTWPRREMLVRFGGHSIVLLPKTREHVQSLHIDLASNRLSDLEAITLANRFLSVLSFHDDQFAIAQWGWSGSPRPIPVKKRDLAFTTASHWFLPDDLPQNDEVLRALALYREGLNSEEAGLPSFAIISFTKVIEVRNPGRGGRPSASSWIGSHFDDAMVVARPGGALERLLSAAGQDGAAKYLRERCRDAAAHAKLVGPSDPDDAQEIRRFADAARVMQALARHFIISELGHGEE